MSDVADLCCFADVETRFRRLARNAGIGSAPIPAAAPAPSSTGSRVIRGHVSCFDGWLQDFRQLWSALVDCCAGPWQVSGPRWPGGDGWDALRALPRASRALDGVHAGLVAAHVDSLPAAEQVLHRFMVDSAGLFAGRLLYVRSLVVADSWRRRFCLMALTPLRYPDLFVLYSHGSDARYGFDRLTRTALQVLSASGDPMFATTEIFKELTPAAPGDRTDEFRRVVQRLRADPQLTAPDRVLAVQNFHDPEPVGSWVDDLLWWCGFVDHGPWRFAVVPAVCAARFVTDRTSHVDLGVGDPAMLNNPFLLDLALAVADVVPSDGSVEPLRFAEGVSASTAVGGVSSG